MKVLLDTHTLIWAIEGDNRLSKKATELIESPQNTPCYSLVSIWEIAIKVQLGKLSISSPIDESLVALLESNGFEQIPIRFRHVCHVGNLPLHHRDPFDRLLIAQAETESIPLISKDSTLGQYNITRIW